MSSVEVRIALSWGPPRPRIVSAMMSQHSWGSVVMDPSGLEMQILELGGFPVLVIVIWTFLLLAIAACTRLFSFAFFSFFSSEVGVGKFWSARSVWLLWGFRCFSLGCAVLFPGRSVCVVWGSGSLFRRGM